MTQALWGLRGHSGFSTIAPFSMWEYFGCGWLQDHTPSTAPVYTYLRPLLPHTPAWSYPSEYVAGPNKQTLHIMFKVLKRIHRSPVDGSPAGWERTAVSQPEGIRFFVVKPPELTSEVHGSHRGAVTLPIRWGCCGPNATSLPTSAYASPPPSWLWGRLPWYPGFISFSDELEKKNPVCPYMLTYFLVSQRQLVCWGVLGSDTGSSVLHPLESSCVVNLSLKWLCWVIDI